MRLLTFLVDGQPRLGALVGDRWLIWPLRRPLEWIQP